MFEKHTKVFHTCTIEPIPCVSCLALTSMCSISIGAVSILVTIVGASLAFIFIWNASLLIEYIENRVYSAHDEENGRRFNTPAQLNPFPVYPVLHWQVCAPSVLMQTAFTSQEWEPVWHSSSSEMHHSCLGFEKTECFLPMMRKVVQDPTYLHNWTHLQCTLSCTDNCKLHQCWYSQHLHHKNGNQVCIHHHLKCLTHTIRKQCTLHFTELSEM